MAADDTYVMQQQSHVPKFGNWDGDNVPYTAFFENARKEKASGVRINPNDPEQNPEAFSIGVRTPAPVTVSISPDNEVALPRFSRQYEQQDSSRRTLSSGSSSNGSSSNPVVKPKKSDNSNSHDFSYRSVSVPKFGQWDENDPRSGTVIFNKVKEEKHVAASKFPPLPLQTTNNYQASQVKETRKKCCCLF